MENTNQDPNLNPQDSPATPNQANSTPQDNPNVVVNLAGPSTTPAEPLPEYQPAPSQLPTESMAQTPYPQSTPPTPPPSQPTQPAVDSPEPSANQVTGSTAPPPPKPKKPVRAIIIGLIALIVLAVGGFMAFRLLGGGGTSTDPVTLTYWGLWDSPAVMQPLIDQYQQQHPHVTIKYEQRPIANHYTTVRSRIQSSNSNSVTPDIVRLHSSWVAPLKNYLSAVPTSVMSASDYEANQYPVTKDTLFQGGNYYAMPISIDGLAMVYNQDLFNEAGITSVPVTWDDVRQAAAQITKVNDRGHISVGGIAMGNATNVDHYAEIVGLLLAQNGVESISQEGQVAFDKAFSADGRNLGAEALAFYTLFTTTEKVWDDTMENSSIAFSKGQVGMILVPSWRIPTLIEQNPQLSIGVTAAPQLVSDRQVGYASYWAEAVPSTSPSQTEAWKFIAWLNHPDQQSKLHNSIMAARTLALPPANPKSASLVVHDQLLAAYVEQASGYRSSIWANNTGSDELNEAINQELAKSIQATRSAPDREVAAATSLTTAATAISQILADQR